MPSNGDLYSNSLYSNEDETFYDSDEGLANELSPTDGYFNQRPQHPQDILIPAPSQGTAAADKAREAREEGETSEARELSPRTQQPQPPTQSLTQSPPRRRLDPSYEEDAYTEQSPLLLAAPPAYSAATAGSSYRPATSNASVRSGPENAGYNTMGQPELFSRNGEPQDLGGTPTLGDAERGGNGWQKQPKRFLDQFCGLLGKPLLVLLALALTVGFILNAVFFSVPEKTGNEVPNTPPGRDQPGNIEYPDVDQICPAAIYSNTAMFTFDDPSQFHIVQLEQGWGDQGVESYTNVRTTGEIRVRPAAESAEAKVRVDIEFHVSESSLVYQENFEKTDDGLSFNTPNRIASGLVDSNTQPCVYILMTVWIAPGLSLMNLEISSQSLAITMYPGLIYSVTNTTFMGAVAGSVHFPRDPYPGTSFYSREIVIVAGSGSVTGSYPLYDLLSIGARSGSVSVDVDLKPASETAPAAAELHLGSESGHVLARTPALFSPSSSIPSRDYRTILSATSGSIDADLVHGTSTQIHGSSGHVKVALSPVGPVNEISSIEVLTHSGSQAIAIRPSLTNPGEPMRKLYGSYVHGTGSLRLKYPDEWEGKIEGRTISGSVRIRWDSVRTIRDGKDETRWRRIKAVRGNGEGTIFFEGASGSVDLQGGSRPSYNGGSGVGEGVGGGIGEGFGERGEGLKITKWTWERLWDLLKGLNVGEDGNAGPQWPEYGNKLEELKEQGLLLDDNVD